MFALTMMVGIAVSVILLELTGLVAGGIIVPAYVSLLLNSPASLAVLLVMALAVMLALRALGELFPLYGTRRYGIGILLGALLNAGTQHLLAHPPLAATLPVALAVEWAAFGYLIPGLIAVHFDRQGIVRTVLMIAIAAPLVRAVVLLFSF
jgi:poly-gamma-glutamate biosynthesis protein PgsC/CapC